MSSNTGNALLIIYTTFILLVVWESLSIVAKVGLIGILIFAFLTWNYTDSDAKREIILLMKESRAALQELQFYLRDARKRRD